MIRAMLVPAILTGVFCAGFTVLIDVATDMLDRGHVIVLSFISGFLGSVFARLVLAKGKDK